MNFPKDFSPPLAVKCATLSNLAYDCLPEKQKGADFPFGGVCLGNFAYILRRESSRVIIAFQGSNDATDFILDACAVICSPEEEKGFPDVHSGFWKASCAVMPPLLEELGMPDPDGPRIVLTGHSLGGGMSLVVALRLARLGYPLEAVYGFGTPRVGKVKFFNRYSAQKIPTFLFIHGRDEVPMIPPWGIQVDTQIWLDLRAYPIKSRLGFPWLNPFRWKGWRADHSMDGYLVDMNKIADRLA